MTDAFLSSGDNLDEFLEAYHEKRKLAHLRRVKVIIVIIVLGEEETCSSKKGQGTHLSRHV